MKIGENLKTIREQHGLTQPQLAKFSGISQQNISRWGTKSNITKY